MSDTRVPSISTHHLRRVVAILASVLLAAGLVAVPDVATAGSGKAHGWATYAKFRCKRVSTSDESIHTDCKVTDLKKDGKGVYLQVKGIRDHNWDTNWWRHSRNVRPGYPATNRLKDDSTVEGYGSIDRWRIRVCKEISNVDDPCSGYSTVDV